MSKRRKPMLAEGWPHALGALCLVGAAAGMIAAASWSRSQTAGRLALFGVGLLLIALIWGSGLLVGLTSVPVLGGAFVSTAGVVNPVWIRAFVVGVLWFLAAQLSWEAIERRDGVRRTTAYTNRLIDETSTVVVLSLVVVAAVFLVSNTAPLRTVFVVAIAMLGIAMVLGGAERRLQHPQPASPASNVDDLESTGDPHPE